MFANFPSFIRQSDMVAVLLALLLVFAMAGPRQPHAAPAPVQSGLSECALPAPCAQPRRIEA